MPSAIVTGATGLLGREIVYELAKDSKQWQTIFALSRSKKEDYPSNVKHHHIDLQTSAAEMAKELKDIKAEYVFFAAYLAQDTEQGAWDVNGAMLDNFLTALKQTGASKQIKRIILVTGAKQYGVHLGEPKNPMVESDPRLTDPRYPPNFYYRQQDILYEFCSANSISWVVTYPNDVIGFARGNFMNLATSVGLYAAVSKELGQDLVFPGSEIFYSRFDCFTDSKLHAQFCRWAAVEEKVGNQAFNVVNGDAETWANMWPLLAARFGSKVAPDQFQRKGLESNEVKLLDPAPLVEFEESAGLKGKIKQSRVVQQVDLVKWSQRKDVKVAWEKLAAREGLEKDAFEKATWGFLGFVLGREYDLMISMSKARKYGWTGYKDTWEAIEDSFEVLTKAKVLPKV